MREVLQDAEVVAAKGRRVHDRAYSVASSFEEAIARQLGRRRFAEFKRALEQINEHIARGDLVMPPMRRRTRLSDTPRPRRRAIAGPASSS